MSDMINVGGIEADIILKLDGFDPGLTSATAKMAQAEGAIRALVARFTNGQIEIQDFTQELAKLVDKKNALAKGSNEATEALNREAAAAEKLAAAQAKTMARNDVKGIKEAQAEEDALAKAVAKANKQLERQQALQAREASDADRLAERQSRQADRHADREANQGVRAANQSYKEELAEAERLAEVVRKLEAAERSEALALQGLITEGERLAAIENSSASRVAARTAAVQQQTAAFEQEAAAINRVVVETNAMHARDVARDSHAIDRAFPDAKAKTFAASVMTVSPAGMNGMFDMSKATSDLDRYAAATAKARSSD